jgi:thiol-disulfide isomerase/thioredoxin
MATPSVMIELGRIAPDFNLQDVISAKNIGLQEIRSHKATVVMFICNHCPYVKHIIDILVPISKEYSEKGISFVAISSNDVAQYPEDGPDKMRDLAIEKNFNFPYLYDETQEVAKAYDAACTPDFFVFDKNLACVYRGQFDDSRPKNTIPVTGKDLTKALDQILLGQPVDKDQKPSIGCNIKWK